MLFLDPSPGPPARNPELAAQGLSQADEQLAEAIRQAGRVALACQMVEEEVERGGAAVVRQVMLDPLPPLADAAWALGCTSVPIDADGSVRRMKVSFGAEQGMERYFMGVVAAAMATGQRPEDLARQVAAERTNHRWLRGCDLLIDFRAPPGQGFRHVPYYQVLEGIARPEWLSGKLVLVGVTSTSLHDVVEQPIRARVRRGGREQWRRTEMAGVELIANVADMLVEGRRIRPASIWAIVAIPVGFSAAVAAAAMIFGVVGGDG